MSLVSSIKQLRYETGASVALCRECLEEADGVMAKAKECLRKKGVEVAAKKSSRATGEGTIGVYLHSNGRLASFVSLRSETDFVARNDEFKQLAKDLAMQVAAMQPLYLAPGDIPNEIKEKEEKDGNLRKYCQTACLLNQPFIKDETRSVESVIQEKIQKLGENIEVGEFVRMVV